jgi:acyl-CoA reductase-like NAD-dependent aldehyde dehydrogenase
VPGAAAAPRLRLGKPEDDLVDIGPLISEPARDRFQRTIDATIDAGAQLLCGGSKPPGRGWFYPPTVLLSETSQPEAVLAGAFGPVVLVRGVKSDDAAVAACNASPFGLSASVWSRDVDGARALAERLDVGMVAVNEAVTPSAHAAAPFGGVKASGYGRTRGAFGLLEFTHPQTVHVRRPGGFRPQLFPYTRRLDRLLGLYRRLFHHDD